MNRPKFEVGEEVILQSRQMPDQNGDWVVEGVVPCQGIYLDRFTNEAVICKSNNNNDSLSGYILSNKVINNNGREVIWCESSLRKKHKPAEMSFSALMQSLTSPVGVQ